MNRKILSISKPQSHVRRVVFRYRLGIRGENQIRRFASIAPDGDTEIRNVWEKWKKIYVFRSCVFFTFTIRGSRTAAGSMCVCVLLRFRISIKHVVSFRPRFDTRTRNVVVTPVCFESVPYTRPIGAILRRAEGRFDSSLLADGVTDRYFFRTESSYSWSVQLPKE